MFGLSITVIIELIAGAIMLIGMFGVLYIQHSKAKGYAFDTRAIQFVAVILVIPSIIVLALEKVLSSETTATLIGALTGYLLSGIGTFKPSQKKNDGKETKVG